MEKIDVLSKDLEKANLDKLREVFPEVFSEGKLDITKLLDLCGEYDIKDFEHYKFEWKGKSECLQIAQRRSIGTLRPKPVESVNFEDTKNLYIKGDNLEVLKLLQSSYYRRVKMIYIDPPYNTGNDFVYNDDFSDPIEHYKQVISQATRSNPETMGQFHTAWLNMMYPRLRLAATLLADDGVVAVNIDEYELVNLLKLMDETFGEENNLGVVVWDKRNPKGDAKGIAYQHEYIVFYAKSRNNLTEKHEIKRPKKNAKAILNKAKEFFNKITLSYTLENANKDFSAWINSQNDFSGGEKAYSKIDDNGDVYRPVSMAWPNKKQAPNDYFIPLIHPITKKPCPVPERGWRNPPTTMKELLNKGQILFGKDETTQPNRKYLLKDNMYENLPSLLYYGGSDTDLLSAMGIPFDTPKVVDVCYEHIQAFTSPNEGDIIIDFFSGSATTAHAVMQLNAEDNGNRQFIMVQLPELTDEKSEAYKAGYKNICDIGMERIRRAGAKILEEYNSKQPTIEEIGEETKTLDIGFKVFELDSSNLKTFNGTPLTKEEKENAHEILIQRLDEMDDQVKPDRTALDMVYEIMLKTGFTLDMTVTTMEVQGKTAYIVDDYLLLIYLDTDITVEIAEELIDLAPGILIIGEDAFNDDMGIMANVDYFCQNKGVRLQIF